MSDEVSLLSGILGGTGGLAFLVAAAWKLRGPAWHAVTRAAIVIANDDCEKKIAHAVATTEAKSDAKIDILLRVIDARAPAPDGSKLSLDEIKTEADKTIPPGGIPAVKRGKK